MSVQSATVTFTRTITVAAGKWAPGHLGELTRFLPFEAVDDLLELTRTAQTRLRDLPTRVGVYYLLALALFPEVGYRLVWDKLVAGLDGLNVCRPSAAALRALRHRVGETVMRQVFLHLAGPLGRPDTPGVQYRGYRTVAFDGCSSIKTPDTDGHRHWLGHLHNRLSWAGYPRFMLMALVETGTRSLLGVRIGSISAGNEVDYARKLLSLLHPNMLLLIDRGFDDAEFLKDVATTKAALLARIGSNRRPPVLTPLPDGSYLSKLGTLPVRIIEAIVTLTLADGSRVKGEYRLATTLTDHRHHPAKALITLYHERWEIESAFYALRHTILGGRVLRSTTQYGIRQEMWAILATYQLLRIAMFAATDTQPNLNPDRASFTIALQHARDQLINATNIIDDPTDPLGTIGRAILANPLPKRRERLSIRRVKCSTSRYARTPAGDTRPRTSTRVTNTSTTVYPRQHTAPPVTIPRREYPNQPRTSRRERVIALLNTHPNRPWHAREILHHIDVRNPEGLRCELNQWTRNGYLDRVAPATYKIHSPTT